MENKGWSHEQLHTVTFRFPRDFRKAVAHSLGRIGDTATLAETEEYLREVVKVNVEALMADHLQRKSVMTAKRTSRPTTNGGLKARVRPR